MATIVQHEAGRLSAPAWKFVADQVTHDVDRLGCQNLTRIRWAIKSRPRPLSELERIVRLWPRRYPPCQLVGYPGDLRVWGLYYSHLRVDYEFTYNGMTVIGVNCIVHR